MERESLNAYRYDSNHKISLPFVTVIFDEESSCTPVVSIRALNKTLTIKLERSVGVPTQLSFNISTLCSVPRRLRDCEYGWKSCCSYKLIKKVIYRSPFLLRPAGVRMKSII